MKLLYPLFLITFFTYAQDFEKVRDSLKNQYQYIGELNKGYAVVINQKKAGAIDSLGNVVLPLKFDNVEFNNELFIVNSRKHYGLYNLKNEEILPIEFDWLLSRENNLFIACKKNKWGVVNSEGNLIIPIEYKNTVVHTIYNDNLFILATDQNSHTGIFDAQGNIIFPFTHKFHSLYRRFILCSDNSGCYLIYLKLASPPIKMRITEVDSFKEYGIFHYEQNGYHIFKKDGKYGIYYIFHPSVSVPPIYDDITPIYSTSEYIVKSKGKYGILNAHNEVVEEIVFDEIVLRKEVMVLKLKNNADKYREINHKGLPED